MTMTSRRDRVHAMTVAEIKTAAWGQMAVHGPAALSLRAVARDMGMAPSALYRYFSSRDDLITELIIDGFGSLADTLEAAYAGGPDGDAMARWITVTCAYRQWALDNPVAYGLIYGTPVPGYEATDHRTKDELIRGTDVLISVMVDGMSTGQMDPGHLDDGLTPDLRERLSAWNAERHTDLPPAALAGCLLAWTQLQGAVMLEVFGHLPPCLIPAGDMFVTQMRDVLIRIGYRTARP